MSISPFTFAQQVYAHQGDSWAADVSFAPMERADAEDLLGFLLSLNGLEGTFLMGDPVNTTARGTWSSGSPFLSGAHAAGVKTLTIDGVGGFTWKRGDWLQIGTGSSTHLHKVMQDGSQTAGSPTVVGTLEIWPRTRAAYTHGEAITISSPKGLWRLAGNESRWSIDLASIYGVEFSCVEALSA